MTAFEEAEQYLHNEPDPTQRREVKSLIKLAQSGDSRALADLQDRFGGTLQFGTAGLRAKMEAGWRRMNRVVVSQAAWAVGMQAEPAKIIVIGYDGRRNSDTFANDADEVLGGLDLPVFRFDSPVPTPVCAFAVGQLKAQAAIMITASHNPPDDNGIKMYHSGGAQMIAPQDEVIAQLIERRPLFSAMQRRALTEVDQKQCAKKSIQIADAYFKQLAAKRWHHASAATKDIPIAYTALHGVGAPFALRGLEEAGFKRVHIEKSQAKPDGRFPTVRFPNPEEKGAMDRVLELARKHDCQIAIANDPDADRFAAAVYSAECEDYVQLSGNEVGYLLGQDVLRHMPTPGKKKLVMTTLVSSRLLFQMAKHYDAVYAESLTGFSNIANTGLQRESKGIEEFAFGYEEALGYCIGNAVRDKDGIGAVVRFAEMVRALDATGQTVWDVLDALYLQFGLHRSLQLSLRFEGTKAHGQMKGVMEQVRQDNQALAQAVGARLTSYSDLLRGDMAEFPKANVVVASFDNGLRLVIRPSGTEPKIKFYLEATAAVATQGQLSGYKQQLDDMLYGISQKLQACFLPSNSH